MKPSLSALPGMYAYWTKIGWSMLLGNSPASEPRVKPAQVSSVQKWENEGGSVGKAAKPSAKPQAKRARRAAPANKRRAPARRR